MLALVKPAPRSLDARTTLPLVAQAGGKVVVLRASAAAAGDLTGAEKEALILAARAGKLVSVLMRAITYVQRATPNRNCVRFAPSALRPLAKSFVGQPFLRDHCSYDSAARGGTILECTIEQDAAGDYTMTQVIDVTDPATLEMILRGNLDRFSIGWEATGPVVCSVCECAYRDGWCGMYPTCEHMPGDSVEKKNGSQICEAVFTSAAGVETSGVVVPAVDGTEIEGIRAALSAARAQHKEPHVKNFALITAVLGLSADVDESVAVAEITKLKDERDGLRATLKDKGEQLDAASGKLAALELAGRESRRANLLKRGIDEGRFLPKSNSEKHAEQLAARGDLDGLQAFIDDLPKGGAAPIGLSRQSGGTDPTPPEIAGALTPAEISVAKQMGIKPEDFLKSKQQMTGGTAAGTEV